MTTRSADEGARRASGGESAAIRCLPCTDEGPSRSRGHIYAVLTAVLCPCHMAVWGSLLAGSAAGVFFERHFWLVAIVLGGLTLLTLARAIRILL